MLFFKVQFLILPPFSYFKIKLKMENMFSKFKIKYADYWPVQKQHIYVPP